MTNCLIFYFPLPKPWDDKHTRKSIIFVCLPKAGFGVPQSWNLAARVLFKECFTMNCIAVQRCHYYLIHNNKSCIEIHLIIIESQMPRFLTNLWWQVLLGCYPFHHRCCRLCRNTLLHHPFGHPWFEGFLSLKSLSYRTPSPHHYLFSTEFSAQVRPLGVYSPRQRPTRQPLRHFLAARETHFQWLQ